MSRWRNWSTGTVQKMGFSNFLAESGTPMPGDPEEIAQQNGWTSKGYGWYQDSSGQIVARNIGGIFMMYRGASMKEEWFAPYQQNLIRMEDDNVHSVRLPGNTSTS